MSEGNAEIPPFWGEKELNFTEEKGQGQLRPQRNKGNELRPKISHHKNLLGQKVYAGVNKVHWGTYKGNPACLLVVRVRFYFDKGLFRLKKAAITVCFNKYPQPAAANDTRADPIVCVYSPKHVWGEPTEEEKETHWEVAARCSVSVGPAGLGPEVSQGGSSKINVEHALEIAGMDEPEYDKDYPNKVIFEIDENEKIGRGIPKELYFGIVVQHEGDIQATVTTNIGDATALPWSKDDPIILQPGKTFGNMPPSLLEMFDHWTDDDWNDVVPYIEERGNVKQGQT
jgi:hypothetical protein